MIEDSSATPRLLVFLYFTTLIHEGEIGVGGGGSEGAGGKDAATAPGKGGSAKASGI